MFYSGTRECMWERECTRERNPKYGDINSSISITMKTAFSVVLIGWIESCTQNKPATSITALTTITYVLVCVFVSGFVHDLVCVFFCLCPYLCIPICWKAVCHCQSGDIYIYVWLICEDLAQCMLKFSLCYGFHIKDPFLYIFGGVSNHCLKGTKTYPWVLTFWLILWYHECV